MKKLYTRPEVEIVKFTSEEIICTSSTDQKVKSIIPDFFADGGVVYSDDIN